MKNISAEASSLYEGSFSAYEFITETDDETGIVSTVKTEYISAKPCRLSYELISENRQSRFLGYKSQSAKLFCSPDIEVKDGSEIAVVQNGRTEEYISSGAAAVYTGHQEINLKIKNVY
ncbi:MAG: hypothetical protein LUD81_01730 [Clostridiales bacterium]|nr:hypothetical protein [Clostridiales bacterium]